MVERRVSTIDGDLEVQIELDRDTWQLGETVRGRVRVEGQGARSLGPVVMHGGCTALGAPTALDSGVVTRKYPEELFRVERVLSDALELTGHVDLDIEMELPRSPTSFAGRRLTVLWWIRAHVFRTTDGAETPIDCKLSFRVNGLPLRAGEIDLSLLEEVVDPAEDGAVGIDQLQAISKLDAYLGEGGFGELLALRRSWTLQRERDERAKRKRRLREGFTAVGLFAVALCLLGAMVSITLMNWDGRSAGRLDFYLLAVALLSCLAATWAGVRTWWRRMPTRVVGEVSLEEVSGPDFVLLGQAVTLRLVLQRHGRSAPSKLRWELQTRERLGFEWSRTHSDGTESTADSHILSDQAHVWGEVKLEWSAVGLADLTLELQVPEFGPSSFTRPHKSLSWMLVLKHCDAPREVISRSDLYVLPLRLMEPEAPPVETADAGAD